MVSGTTQNERRSFARARSPSAPGTRFRFRRRRPRRAAGSRIRGRRGFRPTGDSRPALDAGGLLGFENVQAHDLAFAVVEEQVQEIEMGDAMQAGAEIVEEFAEVAMMRDGFGDFEEGAGAGAARVFGDADAGSWPMRQDSTAAHRSSMTGGGRPAELGKQTPRGRPPGASTEFRLRVVGRGRTMVVSRVCASEFVIPVLIAAAAR